MFILVILHSLPFSVKPFERCYVFYNSKFEFYIAALMVFVVLISFSTQMYLSMRLYVHLKRQFHDNFCEFANKSKCCRSFEEGKKYFNGCIHSGCRPCNSCHPLSLGSSLYSSFEFKLPNFAISFGQSGNHPAQSHCFHLQIDPLIDSLCVLFIMLPYVRARRKFTKSWWCRNF